MHKTAPTKTEKNRSSFFVYRRVFVRRDFLAKNSSAKMLLCRVEVRLGTEVGKRVVPLRPVCAGVAHDLWPML